MTTRIVSAFRKVGRPEKMGSKSFMENPSSALGPTGGVLWMTTSTRCGPGCSGLGRSMDSILTNRGFRRPRARSARESHSNFASKHGFVVGGIREPERLHERFSFVQFLQAALGNRL